MKLSELCKDAGCRLLQGSMDTDVTGIFYDSRKVTGGSLFVCITGAVSDGHDYAVKALQSGAAALLVTRDIREDLKKEGLGEDVTIIITDDSRYALAFMSAAWFGNPAKKLKIIGVTGTKGKTTTTYLIRDILQRSGYKTDLIGTIEIIIGDEHIAAEHTTPESYLIQEYFARMVEKGTKIVVMEVSSQALMLHRTQGFTFDIGVFTNLSPDHIGPAEHKDLDDYIHCKSLLFRQCRLGIVNADDEMCERILEGHTCDVVTYGLTEKADYMADDLSLTQGKGFIGIDFMIKGRLNTDVQMHMPGRFSVYNALCAAVVCDSLGVNPDIMKEAVREAKVKGRIEMIHVSDEFTLMIDYAHNAMALESLLTTLKEYKPKRLVSLFGCGGNRSRLRRFEMGEVSGRLADLTVITSDNPRNEEPLDIIADIKTGIRKTGGKYVEIPDRRDAIKYVIENGQPGDVIVLAGKGHEDYQEIKGEKHHMDERELIEDVKKELSLI
ncbi:MAG: UDP-N-acetylmuramoyl-L-alanyl-D-glutamate--2,6-diaminopimelate ligase [Lachnospiraceae bacterium]|nr:UDP-N-acetylmuramoyl-L-alanyl-D-glutamate--2,6-diaminopimelate ligase [Lachnospiraceae bacterium]